MLSQPRVAASADERCIEALLCRALDVVPGLGGVFGLPDGLRYQFGQRTVQPDVVAIDVEGKYAGGIEVKIRSNFNVNVGGSQFDTYAAGAPADCRLTALVAQSASASKFRAKLTAAPGEALRVRRSRVALAPSQDATEGSVPNGDELAGLQDQAPDGRLCSTARPGLASVTSSRGEDRLLAPAL